MDLMAMAGPLTATATTGRGLLMLSPLQMLMPNPGGMETMDTTATLLMAMATMERDLLMPSLQQMLRPNPGGTVITDILLTAMATTGRGLLMLSQQQLLRLMPSPGGMETMDTTAIQLMAMATMERDLLMPNLLQTPSLGGTEAMDMAGPMVSIGANLKIN